MIELYLFILLYIKLSSLLCMCWEIPLGSNAWSACLLAYDCLNVTVLVGNFSYVLLIEPSFYCMSSDSFSLFSVFHSPNSTANAWRAKSLWVYLLMHSISIWSYSCGHAWTLLRQWRWQVDSHEPVRSTWYVIIKITSVVMISEMDDGLEFISFLFLECLKSFETCCKSTIDF